MILSVYSAHQLAKRKARRGERSVEETEKESEEAC